MKKNGVLLMMLLTLCAALSSMVFADPGGLKTQWRFQTEGAIRADAVVTDNTVYVASTDGRLYALNKQDGKRLWEFETGGALAGEPAVAGNMVIVTSRDNRVYAVNRRTGRLRWSFSMQPDQLTTKADWKYFTAAPVVAQGSVYIGSGSGTLYVLDQRTGRLQWKFRTPGEIRAAALVHQGKVYQPSNDGVVYVLDAANGALQWTFETDGHALNPDDYGYDRKSIYAPPLMVGNTLVIASRDGHVYAVDVTTRSVKWKLTFGSAWAMTTAVDDSTVYVGWSSNNLFSAIDLASGEAKWQFHTGSHNYTTALVNDQSVYFGSADGQLYQLDKASGAEVRRYALGQEIYSSPVYDEDTRTIFLGSDDGNLYALVEGEAAYKAVYHPTGITDLTQYLVVDPKVTPYLSERGYERLESAAQLEQFIQARLGDGAPSVIVFALPIIPEPVIGNKPAKGLMRQYLEAGGKVLWFSDPPNYYSLNEAGNDFHRDPEPGMSLLNVAFTDVTESGNYYSKATQEGKNWGLPHWLKATSTPVLTRGKGHGNQQNIVPLAHDEFGRVAIWVKQFSDAPGSGYVSMRTWGWNVPIREQDLQLIDTVARYGLE